MSMTIKITDNDKGNPAGKVADVELHFTDTTVPCGCDNGQSYGAACDRCQGTGERTIANPLAGLKLIGFGIWARSGGAYTVTFPARQYNVNGERRSFALLRPVDTAVPQHRVRDLILEAYQAHLEKEVTQ